MTSCSDDTGAPSTGGSKAASAASSAASAASSAVASLASEGASALASASAEARRRLDELKGGIDAKNEVRLGAPTRADDGRSTVAVTVHNTADSTKSFVVQVNLRDQAGNLLDTTVVTVDGVGAGKEGTVTARSNRKLSGTVSAEVARALRY
ncbi:FxLYD domain-containing protein [Streptomyces sp. NPDC014006]|uniref:FxLYD domain-containing protein n=1 Tax=Streptomyces sp. NPDC014006 TaxID=3364870 RepID=UPI0036FAE93E